MNKNFCEAGPQGSADRHIKHKAVIATKLCLLPLCLQ